MSSIEFDLDAFLMVIFVDLVLSGDNAIIIGMAAASLPPHLRKKAIVWGIGIAVALRIILASLTFYLLQIIGIKLIGSILLLYVCYGMWRDLRKANDQSTKKESNAKDIKIETGSSDFDSPISTDHGNKNNKTSANALISPEFRRAMLQIIIADVSMSLDNVLAVAGIARENIGILVFGLVLSIVLMAVGATFVAKILQRFHWLGYLGLLIILYVAIDMGYDGTQELLKHLNY